MASPTLSLPLFYKDDHNHPQGPPQGGATCDNMNTWILPHSLQVQIGVHQEGGRNSDFRPPWQPLIKKEREVKGDSSSSSLRLENKVLCHLYDRRSGQRTTVCISHV